MNKKINQWGGALCLASLLLPAATYAAPVFVQQASASAIKKAISAQRGHVVVVNFWATWCGPCVAEFSSFVAFSNGYKSKGVVVMAVSADNKKDLISKVVPFLTQRHATFPVFLINASDPEVFVNAFDPTWQGELPRTFIYNRQGRLVKTLGLGQTTQSLASAVKPYL